MIHFISWYYFKKSIKKYITTVNVFSKQKTVRLLSVTIIWFIKDFE